MYVWILCSILCWSTRFPKTEIARKPWGLGYLIIPTTNRQKIEIWINTVGDIWLWQLEGSKLKAMKFSATSWCIRRQDPSNFEEPERWRSNHGKGINGITFWIKNVARWQISRHLLTESQSLRDRYDLQDALQISRLSRNPSSDPCVLSSRLVHCIVRQAAQTISRSSLFTARLRPSRCS